MAERLTDRPVRVFDADLMRRALWPELGFSKQDRDANVKRLGRVARLLEKHNVTVLVAAISPYRATRQFVREMMETFVEVYVRCPVDECIRRDVHGLYKKALVGEIKGFTGIDAPYEEPTTPEVVVDTDKESVTACVEKILDVVCQ